MSVVQEFGVSKAQSGGGMGVATTSRRSRVSWSRTCIVFVEVVVYLTVDSQTGYQKGGERKDHVEPGPKSFSNLSESQGCLECCYQSPFRGRKAAFIFPFRYHLDDDCT